MVRLIKRYESRKLYDTEESRYVSLEELAVWIREGQQLKVVDNASSEDVTEQTLAQIILELGKNGRARLSSDFLHEIIRIGERAWATGVEQVQQGVDKVVQASMDRLGPVRRAREEMTELKGRLEELERMITDLEPAPATAAGGRARGASGASKRSKSK